MWLKGGNRSFTEGGKCVWVESTASHVMCINTLEGGGRKGFISSAVTCIIRQQHYPHGEAACRAVAYGPVSLSGWKMLKWIQIPSLFFVCLMWECVYVWVRRNRAHTFEQLENLLLFFFLCGWKYFGISRVFLLLLLFFCRSFYDDEVGGRLKVSFKSKMRLLVTCVTQGRDCLSLSGSLCFALFFFPPSPNSFYLLRVLPIASIPNPIFLTWPFSSCCFTPLG